MFYLTTHLNTFYLFLYGIGQMIKKLPQTNHSLAGLSFWSVNSVS